MKSIQDLRIHLYADGADLTRMSAMASYKPIAGFTLNPSLMRRLGVTDYEKWSRKAVEIAGEKPLSLEVLSDDFTEMKRQALKIASWGENVYVKIPITNSQGVSSLKLISELATEGVKLNVTALLTTTQVMEAAERLVPAKAAILSVFAGRIADTGRDAASMMKWCSDFLRAREARNIKLLWASTREVHNIIQADQARCDIITVPPDILAKAEKLLGYDLEKLSLETVQMFAKDAKEAGYTL